MKADTNTPLSALGAPDNGTLAYERDQARADAVLAERRRDDKERECAGLRAERDAFRDALCNLRECATDEWIMPLEDGPLDAAEYIDTVLAAHGADESPKP